MKLYGKFFAQILAAVLAAIIPALAGDNHIDSSEWNNVVILALGAFAVLGAGELPEGVWRYMKVYASAATAVAVLLQSFIGDGITTAEWFQLAIAALGALGVSGAPAPVVYNAEQVGRHAAALGLGPKV